MAHGQRRDCRKVPPRRIVRRTVAAVAPLDQRRPLPAPSSSDQAQADGLQHCHRAQRPGRRQWF